MAQEIEHKYLVRPDRWMPSTTGALYRQGYLSSVKERVVRVRIVDNKGYLTIKGLTTGITRSEFEYSIPLSDAATMLDSLCERPLIEKTRYHEPFGKNTWEVDVFHGDNDGLIVAELEVPDETTKLEPPPWLGTEVSNDVRYFNSNLIANPYKNWRNSNV